MASIIFWKETIYCNIFRCNYLRNKKSFLHVFFHFLNLYSILNIFKKKMTLIADVFSNFRNPKDLLDKCLKTPVSEDPWTSNMVNGPKIFSKLNDTTFTIFTDACEGNSGCKSLYEWYAES